MSARTLYRIATVLFVLFAAGHTVGFLRFRPQTAAGLAVQEAMTSVHFQIGGSTYSYGDFYQGFGLYATLYLLFSAFLAWHLGMLAGKMPRAVGMLGWLFCGVQAVSLVLSALYFAAPPAVLSGLLVVCLGWAAAGVERTKAA